MTTAQIKRGVVGASIVLALGCLVARLMTNASASAQEKPPAQQPTPQEDKPSEQVYKNIQVFKGVPASRLMPGMQRLTQFLGVDCAHCHVPNEFEKDDKPAKPTARKMFRMVRLVSQELNTNRITCYTCHRGKPQPEPPPESWKAEQEEMMKQAAQDSRPAEQVYQNIQTLKGVPAGRWKMIMTMFTKSLGVDCTHCHVPDAYEKDDKPAKQMARKMLSMVGTVAREVYQGPTSINCYTCHRGQLQPVSMPPAPPSLPKFDDKPPEIKSSASLLSVDQVLAKYVQALGGQAAIEKVTTRIMKGAMVTQGGMSAPLEVYEKAPNKTLTTFRTPMGATFMGFNGAVGWTQAPENGLREASGAELANIRRNAEFYRDLKLKERYSKMFLLGSAKLSGREMYVIEAAPPEGNPEKLYFDASTGLLIRQDVTVGNAPRETSIQIYFEDYREVDGVKLPFAIRRSRPDFTWIYKFDEIKLNTPVENTKFNKPPAQ